MGVYDFIVYKTVFHYHFAYVYSINFVFIPVPFFSFSRGARTEWKLHGINSLIFKRQQINLQLSKNVRIYSKLTET